MCSSDMPSWRSRSKACSVVWLFNVIVQECISVLCLSICYDLPGPCSYTSIDAHHDNMDPKYSMHLCLFDMLWWRSRLYVFFILIFRSASSFSVFFLSFKSICSCVSLLKVTSASLVCPKSQDHCDLSIFFSLSYPPSFNEDIPQVFGNQRCGEERGEGKKQQDCSQHMKGKDMLSWKWGTVMQTHVVAHLKKQLWLMLQPQMKQETSD